MASEVLHLNGNKNLDCLLRYLQLGSVRVDKKKVSSLNEGPILKGNKHISGLVSVAKAIIKNSNHINLLGEDDIENAEIDQWLYYCKYELKNDVKQSLKALNGFLADKVFFVNNRFTLVDIFIYSFLERELEHYTHSEMETYTNVFRWFDQVQHASHIRQKPKLRVQRTPLY